MKAKDITILLVDDEPDILDIISYNLKAEGYKVKTASSGREGVEKAKKVRPDLILLDVMMPEMDGIEACEQIRKTPGLEHTIIAFLTARGEDYSQVAGFEVGADDYIAKPVKPKVLTSRLKALLRRRPLEPATSEERTTLGDMVIDIERYHIEIKGKVVELPRKEFELLGLLASKPGKVFTRDEIMDRIWGTQVIVGGRTIDVHIRKLREKIGDERIKTIKGVGYKFEDSNS
ncbi:response regulator transcription factor [Schleiferiaceae bacterium]|jgi:two-component system alkaline phosphatase synthesis response regulator PhoP|nr:response regulator transcription factor [Bacteroidota bacterium]MCH9810689.1 response regulator transcription factor [Bacteroidota bacterium]MCO4791576.1 response regulator transcription factor [Flavobacteriales bacterium]MDA7721766.1 response regulator transcription factor [Schleiferiaceae bacterium]MDC1363856.1 response regulator transcription factor [Schleiferiaceae bacterium]